MRDHLARRRVRQIDSVENLHRHLLKRLGPLLPMFTEVYDLRRRILQRLGLLPGGKK